ncbi:MAG: outer membrane protein transport protein, partial [Gammaproteobacteria bacterium]
MKPTIAFVPPIRTVVATAVTAALVTLASGGAHAAFFQLAENSPAGLGNAFAGGAAIAEDASTVWYNPAGMTR